MIDEVKKIFKDGDFTCVLSDGKETVTSRERGVKPLVGFLESGKDFRGFAAADKIVGKAAAMLYACMGISRLYAEVTTAEAAEVCRRYRIDLSFDTLTDKIINRRGDDICPMEKLIIGITDPAEAQEKISQKLKNLSDRG